MATPAPESFYDFFRGLAKARVGFLVTGRIALTLHGIPRLTDNVELLLEPGEENGARARAVFSAWGFAAQAGGVSSHPGAAVTRLAHPTASLGLVDLVLVPDADWATLSARATVFHLVDLAIPAVSRDDLLLLREGSGSPEGREDAASIRLLAAVEGGATAVEPGDVRREQLVKFQRWHTENRCEWLLAAFRLGRGLPPEQSAPRNPRFRSTKPWKR
jgi:hypothetical protein